MASLTDTADHLPQYVELLRPQGQIAVIDDMPALDVMPLKRKSLSLHWELMFTRSLFGTPDLDRQGALLLMSPGWWTPATCAPRSPPRWAPSTRPTCAAPMRWWKAARPSARWCCNASEAAGTRRHTAGTMPHARPAPCFATRFALCFARCDLH